MCFFEFCLSKKNNVVVLLLFSVSSMYFLFLVIQVNCLGGNWESIICMISVVKMVVCVFPRDGKHFILIFFFVYFFSNEI